MRGDRNALNFELGAAVSGRPVDWLPRQQQDQGEVSVCHSSLRLAWQIGQTYRYSDVHLSNGIGVRKLGTCALKKRQRNNTG